MQGHNENNPFVVKLLVYIGGVLLGLSAKLATLNMEKALTLKEVLFHTSVAFACAWVVWLALAATGKQDMALISAVIIGRFGDSMLLAIYKAIKKGILNIFKADE